MSAKSIDNLNSKIPHRTTTKYTHNPSTIRCRKGDKERALISLVRSPWRGFDVGSVFFLSFQYVFGMPLDASQGYNYDDARLAHIVMTYWSNFAKTG